MPEQTKGPADTAIQTRYVVMPQHANQFGTAFGGVLMSWIDMTAGMAAQRHCGSNVVTASIDSMSFEKPVHIGQQVVLLACVNYVGRTSMEVGVKVVCEDPGTTTSYVATKAYLTFVAVDPQRRPLPVPRLEPKTADEMRRWKNAALRVAARKELRNKVRCGG
ncbi:MAG: acyl-CoA thioesterase [Planctomycetaceae bacterium]|nr:acyl-CoA thioesterase [Planctomycetaceae bacterium]